MLRKLFTVALALAGISCDAVDRCLDQGGSYNYQIAECDFERSQPGPKSPCLHRILGTWWVIGHQAPGISAMSTAEADAWIGKQATYQTARAAFDGEGCAQATYSSRLVDGAEFMNGFGIPAFALGLPESEICITEIGCPEHWLAPGSLLIHSSNTLFTIWDGVFFELQRDQRSVRRRE